MPRNLKSPDFYTVKHWTKSLKSASDRGTPIGYKNVQGDPDSTTF